MSWSEPYRIASFVSLVQAGATRDARLTAPADDVSRCRNLGWILWLDLGVQLGYFTRSGADQILKSLPPAFDGIYDWLKGSGRVLPDGLVDTVLRIKGDGLLDQRLRADPPPQTAGRHYCHAIAVSGAYAASDQGLWSPLAGAIMFASDEEWESVIDAIDAESESNAEQPRPFVDDAPGLLRCLDAMLTVSNVAARDKLLNGLQQEQLSNALLSCAGWALNLGHERPRDRFSQFYERLTDRVVKELDASPLAYEIQADVSRLRDAWRQIAHPSAEVVSVR